MAVSIVLNSSLLARNIILAPERYDPRRSVAQYGNHLELRAIVGTVRDSLQPSQLARPAIVLDTSDAREGFIVSSKYPTTTIGSAKKIAKAGDVIISRLRPYLRQVAFVDDSFGEEVLLLCSTEFFVLRTRTGDSIAFLVPFLLSEKVQTVLSASQEGGHHPRFQEESLLSLSIAHALVENRQHASSRIEELAAGHRKVERGLKELVKLADSCSSD
jgi:hypothetical protein